LHGAWLPAIRGYPSRFAFWGEHAPPSGWYPDAAGTCSARPSLDFHPYAAGFSSLHEVIAGLLPAGTWPGGTAGGPDPTEMWQLVCALPTYRAAPLLSPSARGAGAAPVAVAGDDVQAVPWTVPAICLDVARAAPQLMSMPQSDDDCVALADDLLFWISATRFGLQLLRGCHFLPSLEREGGSVVARWRPLLTGTAERASLQRLARAMPPASRSLIWQSGMAPQQSEPALCSFLASLVDSVARYTRIPRSGLTSKHASGADAWLDALTGNPVVQGNAADLNALLESYRAWTEQAADKKRGGRFRLCLRLEPPADDSPVLAAQTERPWTLHYLLQSVDDPSLLMSAPTVWRSTAGSHLDAPGTAIDLEEALLAGLGRAALLCPPIEASLHAALPACCRLSGAEALTFLQATAASLQAEGIGVHVPTVSAPLALRMRFLPGDLDDSGAPPTFTKQTLMRFHWQVALGDQLLTPEEFQALAQLKEPLVQVRGRWIELRQDDVGRALSFFRQQPASGQVAPLQAIRMALSPQTLDAPFDVEVTAGGWMEDILDRLGPAQERAAVEEPPGFVGVLRPYQKVGVAWLAALRQHGLGACLADDMGLGKTIMLIALLLHQPRRELTGASAPALLICPTSVVGNWQHELARFAPSLRVLVHHGADRNKEQFAEAAQQHDVVISTYALLHRDEPALSAVQWGDLVLDEAQNVKNASTRTARVAQRLRAEWKAALTGTPVENRLSELWSIFQCLNPGYLGSAEEFKQRLSGPIERTKDAGATSRLKALVNPFILRRLKTDPSVIRDLPEKNEMKVFCSLTKEQATLYQATVQDALRRIEAATGLRRRGEILALLTKLKQICDHPALFLHDHSALAGRSGKLTRLGEMLEEAEAEGDHALVFTQYAEMGELLKRHLERSFGRAVPFLHGGVVAKERDRMVAQFQEQEDGARIFVLSVKAGGTGLNLTRANRVFHYDRWWNPAVENQATDRAFRIGQQRNVQVHKLVCSGTMEETLDSLITRKLALSEAIVGAGEAWITEMSADELRELFALRQEMVGEW